MQPVAVPRPATACRRTARPNHGFDPEHPFGIAPTPAPTTSPTGSTAAGLADDRRDGHPVLLRHRGLARPGRGLHGRRVDRFISFFIDVFLTIPFLLAALAIAPIINERFASSDNYPTHPVLGPGRRAVDVRLDGGGPPDPRRGALAARARVRPGRPGDRGAHPPDPVQGAPAEPGRPIVVGVSLVLPAFVAAEAGLAYLGIGVTSGASWGRPSTPRCPTSTPTRSTCGSRWSASSRSCSRSTSSGDAIRDAWTPRPSLATTDGDSTDVAPALRGTNTERKAGQNETEQATGGCRRCRDVRPRRVWRFGGGGDDSVEGRTASSPAAGEVDKDPDARAPLPRSRAPRRAGPSRSTCPDDPGPDSLDPTDGWSVTGNSIQQALTTGR